MAQKLRIKGLVAAAATVAALIVGGSSATAAVQLNNAPITTTATAVNPILIESTGIGSTVNCTASQIRGTVQSNGTGTIARGDAMFGTCSVAGLGTVTFSHLGAWSISTSFLLDRSGQIIGVSAVLTIPAGTARISGTNCTFDLSGTAESLQNLTATTPPALVTIRSLPFSSIVLGLTVSNATGSRCAGSGISNGDAARINANYSLSSVLTGTLVL